MLNAGNNGPNNATNTRVNYRLPFGLEYQSTNGNYNHNTGLWTVSNLANGTTNTLEIIARIINSGSLVNTGTISGAEFDPQPSNNQASLTLSVPNPAAEEQLPEVPLNLPSGGEATLPSIPNIEEGMNLDPNKPVSGASNNPEKTLVSNGPGSRPGTVGGNDQLYRDQMYVRDYVGSPLTDPKINNPNGNNNNNQTKPEMPGWDIDTSLIGELLLAAFMMATTAAAVILAERESKQTQTEVIESNEGVLGKFGKLFGKTKVNKDGTINYRAFIDSILAAATLFEFIVSPSFLTGVILFVGMFGFVFSFIAKMMYSPLMSLYSIAMLSIMSFFIVKRYWEYSHGNFEKMGELLKKDLETISETLKKLFLLK